MLTTLRPFWRLAAATTFAVAAATAPALAQGSGDGPAITVVISEEPVDLDPGNTDYRDISQITKLNVLEPLIFQDIRDASLNPRLATDWERVDDTTWRFILREGVTFHDGTPFNADAVVHSVERIFSEDISSIVRAQFFGDNRLTATAVDDMTVDLSVETPDPILLTRIAQVMMTSPETPMDQLVREPIGTGPYRFAEWDAGVEIVLERNDDYWGEAPQIEQVTFVWRSEPTVAAQMVEVGEADITMSIPEDLATTEMDVAYPNFVTLYLIPSAWEAPIDDVRVRRAINYAIDREALVGTLLPEEERLAVALFPPQTAGYPDDLEPYPHDPERARELLAEAAADGVDVDAEIQMIGINGHFPRSDEVIEAISAMLNDAGFNTRVRIVETALYRQYRDKPRLDEGPVILQANHDNTTGDAAATVGRHLCTSNRNPVCDEKLDEMIKEAGSLEGEARAEAFAEVARYMHEEVLADILITHRVGFARMAPRLEFDIDGRNAGNFFIEEMTVTE